MLKAEMHTHCNDDPKDTHIQYSAEELMEEAASQGYDVLSITLHDELYFPERYKEKAEELDLVLIPGVELRIQDCDVLAYNISREEASSVKTFEDLKELRREDTLITAPHPYLPLVHSLHERLDEYSDYFDAVEKSFFYLPFLNYWNKKAERAAEKYGLSLVGNSDVHRLWQLGCTYTLVDAEKNVDSVIKAIKEGKTEVRGSPLPVSKFLAVMLNTIFGPFKWKVFS